MKIIGYLTGQGEIDIRPAPLERDWMDGTPVRFAYRCLPLNIANAYGWELLCPSGFRAVWSGGEKAGSITIVADNGTSAPAISHFGSGILTFPIACLFRTDPEFDLMAQGPINRPKDGIAALSGLIETDWLPFTFTMNWRFTRPAIPVRFEKGEPYCHIFPVRRSDLESVEPEIRSISEAPELAEKNKMWNVSRESFNADLNNPHSEAVAQKWQKFYYAGKDSGGDPLSADNHRTKLRLRPFKRIRPRST
jgi:hypothetical protein